MAEIRMRKAWKARFGWFTLGELIVVVTILAILATVGFLALSGYTQDAKNSAAKTNVRSVYSAIVSESAVTGNSARYYVVHDPVYALSGWIVAIDGNPKTLTGWDWNQPWTNYSAGNPDFVKLKMNPEKFRVSDLLNRIFSLAYSANTRYPIVWAAELTDTQNGKTRQKSYVQAVGITPDKIAYVTGNYPVWASGSVTGLVKDIANPSLTWALLDGGSAGNTIACPSWSGLNGSVCVASLPGTCGTSNGQSFSSAPSTNLCTSTGGVSTVTGSGPWNWSCLWQYGGWDAACMATKFAYKCLCNNDPGNTVWYVSSNLSGGGCSAYSTCGNCGNGGWVFWTCYAQ